MPAKTTTPNRRRFLNAARRGELFAKCNYRLTDDYAWDNASGFGKMAEYLPVNIVEDGEDSKVGSINFREWEFKTKSGRVWVNKDGTFTLLIHQNLCYTVEIRKEGK